MAVENLFELVGTSDAGGGAVRVDFRHTHPLFAPDQSVQGTSTNRADFGYTGRLLVLADLCTGQDEEDFTFAGPDGDVILNPNVVTNPDGYMRPKGVNTGGDALLWDTDLFAPDISNFTTNTFPYVLLADDGKHNRTDLADDDTFDDNYSNPGVYDLYGGGWQFFNMVADCSSREQLPIHWFGYDYLHQGQSIDNFFILGPDYFDNGICGEDAEAEADLDLAIVVKWTSPRVPSNNFLPDPDGTDCSTPLAALDAFAYRGPHGALDCSVVHQETASCATADGRIYVEQFTQGAFPSTIQNSTPIRISVRDWDSAGWRADPEQHISEFNSDATDVGAIPAEAAGPPVVTLVSSDLFGIQSFGIPRDSGSGYHYDPYIFEGVIGNAGITTPTNDEQQILPVLVIVDDPEADALTADSPSNNDWYTHTGMIPGSDPLAAGASRRVAPRTYQIVNVHLDSRAIPLNVAVSGSGCGESVTFTVVQDTCWPPAGDDTRIFEWDFDNGAVGSTTTVSPFAIAVLQGAGTYNGTVTISRTITDADSVPQTFVSDPFPFEFEVEGETPISLTASDIEPTSENEADNGDGGLHSSMAWIPSGAADFAGEAVVCYRHDPTSANAGAFVAVVDADDGTQDLSVRLSPAGIDRDIVQTAVATDVNGFVFAYMESDGDLWARLVRNDGDFNATEDVSAEGSVATGCVTTDQLTLLRRSSGEFAILFSDNGTNDGLLLFHTAVSWNTGTTPPALGSNDTNDLTETTEPGNDGSMVEFLGLLHVSYASDSNLKVRVETSSGSFEFDEPMNVATASNSIIAETSLSVVYDFFLSTSPPSERLGLAYRDGSGTSADLRYVESTVFDPDDSSEWTDPATVDATGSEGNGFNPKLVSWGGSPVVVYFEPTSSTAGKMNLARQCTLFEETVWNVEVIQPASVAIFAPLDFGALSRWVSVGGGPGFSFAPRLLLSTHARASDDDGVLRVRRE